MSSSPNPERSRPPTLADVGRIAGVSAMAVSAVLNGSNSSIRVSEETQARIRKAAAELNYRPNIAARALVNRRMNTIGALMLMEGRELNHYFLEVFNGIIEGANKHKQNVTVFSIDSWSDAKAQLQSAFDGRIDGMILIAPVVSKDFSEGLSSSMPCVSLHSNTEIDGLINLESAEELGAYEMVMHLIEKGHRRIMHLGGRREQLGAERRIAGYKRALVDAGIRLDESLLKSMSFSYEAARDVMATWLRENQGETLPDAIFCANDQMALGCIETLSQAGFRVPDDVSVCGFDDTLAARITMPPLTTVRQPLHEMGSQAVSILIDKIEGNKVGAEAKTGKVVFPTELMIRKSVEEKPLTK